jgi:co-chaperonin GroES (HSP10)
MKTLGVFIVKIDKPIKDTIKTESGLELFIDTKWNEFEYRQTSGEVLSPPLRLNTGVSVGDTLYFHHLVVMEKGQRVAGTENQYIVKCDPKYTIGNQAIAYKSKETSEIIPLFGWVLLRPYEEDNDEESGLIQVVNLKEKPVTRGVVAFDCPDIQELGIKVGDVVGFAKNMDYRVDIDGEELYRVRAEDLLYVKKN